ncbi:unnamed protein product, partial [Laminaria digitata]
EARADGKSGAEEQRRFGGHLRRREGASQVHVMTTAMEHPPFSLPDLRHSRDWLCASLENGRINNVGAAKRTTRWQYVPRNRKAPNLIKTARKWGSHSRAWLRNTEEALQLTPL